MGIDPRLAKQAVQFDYDRQYPEALTLYGVCCSLLNAEITVVYFGVQYRRRGIRAVTSPFERNWSICVLCTAAASIESRRTSFPPSRQAVT